MDEFDARFEVFWWGQFEVPHYEDVLEFLTAHGCPADRLAAVEHRLNALSNGWQRELNQARDALADRLRPFSVAELADDEGVARVLALLADAVAAGARPDQPERRRRLVFELTRQVFYALFRAQVRPDPRLFQDRFPDPADKQALAEVFEYFSRSHSWRFRACEPVEVIGTGGQAEIVGGVDDVLGRPVAIKRLRIGDGQSSSRPARERRLVREARITAALEHPGIPSIYGVGHRVTADGHEQLFIAMERLRGRTLEQHIEGFHAGPGRARRCRRDNPAFVHLLRHFLAACEVMAYAHAETVLHRDLKPKNIYVGGHGETYVIDWGLAKELGRPDDVVEPAGRPAGVDATSPYDRVGTFEYMSPEQAERPTADLTPAADVFGLGATLFTLLTGRRPPETLPPAVLEARVAQAVPGLGPAGPPGGPAAEPTADDDADADPADPHGRAYAERLRALIVKRLRGGATPDRVRHKLQETRFRIAVGGGYPPPRAVHRDVDLELDRVCRRAMAADPATRFPSGAALARAVEAWLNDEPQASSPEDGLGYRLRTRVPRWLRRHPVQTATGILLALALGAATVGYFVRRAHLAAEDARQQAEDARQERVKAVQAVTFNALVGILDLVDQKLSGDVPNAFRLAVLDRMLVAFEQYLKATADVPDFLLDRAKYGRRVAEVCEGMGRLDDADGYLRRATDELRDAAAESVPAARALAEMLHLRADILADQNRVGDADEVYKEALGWWERLESRLPEDQRDVARRGQARVTGYWGDMYLERYRFGPGARQPSDLRTARARYEDSDRLRKELLDRATRDRRADSPASQQAYLDAKAQVAHSLNNLANTAWATWWVGGQSRDGAQSKEVMDAIGNHEKAIEYQREVARDTTVDRDQARDDLGGSLLELSLLELARGEFARAEKYALEAAKVFEELIAGTKGWKVNYESQQVRAALATVRARLALGNSQPWTELRLESLSQIDEVFNRFKEAKVDPRHYQRLKAEDDAFRVKNKS
jgi:serine/threonine protein kinase